MEQNHNLREMRTKLVMLNEQLQQLVAERTTQLQNEIEERKRIEATLASEEERLSVTLRSIGDAVITTNTEGRIFLMNRAAEELTGWPQEEAIGKTLTSVVSLIDQDQGERRNRRGKHSQERRSLRAGRSDHSPVEQWF